YSYHSSIHHLVFSCVLLLIRYYHLLLYCYFFFLMLPPPPRSTLFPYTTLFRSVLSFATKTTKGRLLRSRASYLFSCEPPMLSNTDRKSTRLNSSHLGISYAVFCLKKKKKKKKIKKK